jgi:hypothetical protein
MMDPRRMWRRYFETNPVFLGLVVRATVRRLFRSLRSKLHWPYQSRPDPLGCFPPHK